MQQDIIERLTELGVFSEYRIVDLQGFEKLMTAIAMHRKTNVAGRLESRPIHHVALASSRNWVESFAKT